MKSPRQILDSILKLAAEELASDLPLIELSAGVEAEVECGKSGTVTDMHGQTVEFNPANLTELAGRLNPDAQVKIGHVKIATDTPHYGDVTGLRYDASRDRILAKIVPTPALVRKNREEGFRRVSMELSAASARGPFSLTDLAFLAARKPAFKDLAPVDLAAHEGERVFVFAASDDPGQFEIHLNKQAPDAKKATVPPAKVLDTDENVDSDEGENPKMEKETEKLAADLAATQADLQKQKSENERIREQLKTGARAHVKAFLAENVKRIPVTLRQAGLEEFLIAALASEVSQPVTLKFSAPDGRDKTKEIEQSPAIGFMAFLAALPEQIRSVEARELATDAAEQDDVDASSLEFAGADPESIKLDLAVQAEMKSAEGRGEKLTYLEATRVIERRRIGRAS